MISRVRPESTLPQSVKHVLDDGYTIVSKGLLCWSPIQISTKRFSLRYLFLALEATFSIVLWAMLSRIKDYGMPPLYPWSIDVLDYDGCCNHSTLVEHVTDENEVLTLEQITAKELALKQRESTAKSAKYFEFKRLDFQGWKARQRMAQANYDPVKKAATAQKTRIKSKATRKFACDICNVAFQDSNDLNTHNTTRKHIDNAIGVDRAPVNVTSRKYYCEPCDSAFRDLTKLNRHRATQKHVDKATAADSTSTS